MFTVRIGALRSALVFYQNDFHIKRSIFTNNRPSPFAIPIGPHSRKIRIARVSRVRAGRRYNWPLVHDLGPNRRWLMDQQRRRRGRIYAAACAIAIAMRPQRHCGERIVFQRLHERDAPLNCDVVIGTWAIFPTRSGTVVVFGGSPVRMELGASIVE